jgi:hypothetical protein
MSDAEGLPVGTLIINAFRDRAIIILHSLGLNPADRHNFRFMIVTVDENGSIRIVPCWFLGRINMSIAREEGRIVEPNGEG